MSLSRTIVIGIAALMAAPPAWGGEALRAGVARVEISDPRAARINDPCFAKALVLSQGDVTAVLVTVDAVAIGGIGAIRDDFLANVRQALAKDPGIPADRVIVNASHCHGLVRGDSDQLVIQAVREAWKGRTPVKVGAGSGTERRISENRRVTLKDGSQVDMRRAYAFAWDREIASVGPIDPSIGLLRIDHLDGRPLAAVYQFACHPIMNPPSKGSSADFPGFASPLIEKALGHGAMAFFIQGCGGDINPVRYKEANRPPDAEPLGHLLGASVLEGLAKIVTAPEGKLAVERRVIAIPRAADYRARIEKIEAERDRLVNSLKGTNINFKQFLPLLIQQRVDPEFPSALGQGYLHDRQQGRDDLARLDAENRAHVEAYLANIKVMEQLTRLNTNLDLLRMHRRKAEGAGLRTVGAEVCGLRVGDFKLLTFPGELTVEIGLNLKKTAGDPHMFVAGYTNGYLYYTPTVEQRGNTGFAQEDCDCMVAPEWQAIFEAAALEVLHGL